MAKVIESTLGDSKEIISNQTDIHDNLAAIVHKHLAHRFQKPFQAHTLQAFEQMNEIIKNFDGEVILDSCCGVGQSSRLLAQRYPNALVIGVDKSAHRLNRNVDELLHLTQNEAGDKTEQVNNFHLVRADLNDFYRLVRQANWPVTQHYILYPNPWPKSKHVQRRWHGSAVFPDLIQIGEKLILRSNWRLYLEEFQFAAKLMKLSSTLERVSDDQPLTPFEAKYQASGQQCWQLSIIR